MDDTTSLLSELLRKLAELDRKVSCYAQEVAQEFTQYTHQLLQDAPAHVSLRVREDVADELMNYPALGPTLTADPASPFADLRRPTRRGRISPPPLLPHTSGVPPHEHEHEHEHEREREREREREFHGLFIPSYLPLLEVMPPNKIQSSPVGASALAHSGKGLKEAEEPLQQTIPSNTTAWHEPAGRLTPEATSPASVESGACRRRSALRRSSSGSARGTLSPRRVRFEVEGEEVPTTASPPVSPRLDELVTAPPIRRVIPLSDGTVFEETEVNDIDVLGNSPPGPKKISSTERLKALARSSTEDTSKWTVVGGAQDDDDEDDALVMSSSKKKRKANSHSSAEAIASDPTIPEADRRLDSQKFQADDSQSLGISREVDGGLNLPLGASLEDKKRSAHPQPTGSEVPPGASNPAVGLAPATSLPVDLRILEKLVIERGGEEDMFRFEEDPSEDVPSKYIAEEDEEEQITPLAGKAATETSEYVYSKSPAAPIAKPASVPSISPATSLSKHLGASTGSYNGKPFMMGVVRDENIHKKAAEMGDVYSFVGSVDGRSGVDESYSYRPDLQYFDGTPKSLGERLMEEAFARRNPEQMHKPE